MDYCNEVIDLTESFSLADHRSLANNNMIIELDTDDSFSNSFIGQTIEDIGNSSKIAPLRKGKQSLKINKKQQHQHLKQKQLQINRTITEENNSRIKSVGWGDCPICWDRLGNNPVASTKCGHVYCMKCLEKSLKVEKKCPTCRHVLRGSSAYHPLYLN